MTIFGMAKARRLARGFTLIEVLVALVVVAVSLGVLMRVGGEQARNQDHARSALMAQWVASNTLAELRLDPPDLQPQRFDRLESMAGERWQVEVQISEAGAPGFWRVEVRVARAEAVGNLAHLQSYFAQ